jgi:FkbM family methyltransferase
LIFHWRKPRHYGVRIAARLAAMLGPAGRDAATYWVTHYGVDIEPELARLEDIIQAFLVDTARPAVDVGANAGVWAKRLRNRFHRVIAIEPNPVLAAMLKKQLPVEVHNVAASNRGGMATLWIPLRGAATISGWASLDPENCSDRTSLTRVEVRTTTLDQLLEGVFPSFVKVDVEGHEVAVLEGAVRTLTVARPLVLCEVRSANLPRVQVLMGELDYYVHPTMEVLGLAAANEMYLFVPRTLETAVSHVKRP